tara:strand:- start:1053 stop:1610 length:558 start_codon:yes stop_codon:yes gene_type:complete
MSNDTPTTAIDPGRTFVKHPESFGTPPDPVLKESVSTTNSQKLHDIDKSMSEFASRKTRSAADKATEQRAKLPQPTGYRILIIPETVPTESKGGIHLAEQTMQVEQLASVVGYVLALGPDAYKDPLKYPEGAWCKEGDYIIFGRYAGAKITMHGEKQEEDLSLRLLNDDEILAVVSNPNDYVGVK